MARFAGNFFPSGFPNGHSKFRSGGILLSRGRKQDHQSSSNKDTDELLVISIGTPMVVPANTS